MRKPLLSASLLLLLCLCSLAGWAQRTVSGRVTSSEDKSGLPGVNVVLKGTTQGTNTNLDGDYTLTVPDDPSVILTFSSIGFATQELPIGAGGTINVVMEGNVKVLNEAIVIGYGSTTKRDLTGSVVSVTSKDFQKGIITTPDQLISGKVAGVTITPQGGGPGSGSVIRIRGGASLNASNDPLIVVDGVPLDPGGLAGSPNPLSLINPNDIETFTVLKDASAAAIYGSRASNGVILITTKRGAKGGKPNVSISSQNSLSFVRRYLPVLSGDEFRSVILDTARRLTAPQIAVAKRLLGRDTTISTNWQKQIFQPAFTSDNNIAFAGGVNLGKAFQFPYRVSGGYLTQDGILKTDHMQRFSATANVTPTFLDNHLKADINAKASTTQSRFADAGAIGGAISFDPTKPVRADTLRPDGSINQHFNGFWEWNNLTNGQPAGLSPRNPVGLIYNNDNRSQVYRFLNNVRLDYAVHTFESLHLVVNLANDFSRGLGRQRINNYAAQATSLAGYGSFSQYKQEKRNQLYEVYADYNHSFGDVRVDVVAGHAWQNFISTNFNFRTFYGSGDTIAGNVVQFPYDVQENTLVSYFSRATVSFRDRYLLTGSIRSDGSSRFAPATRYGYFPGGSAAYRIIQEDFFTALRDKGTITELKLRVGYGTTGQQEGITNYGYQGAYGISNTTAQYQLGDQFYYMQRPGAYNSQLKWESTATLNLALDFGFLKDRITGSVDVYQRKTRDLLVNTPVPAGSNFTSQLLANIGNVDSRGIEIAVNTIPVQTKDFQLSIGFNVTLNRNKISKLYQVTDTSSIGIQTGGVGGGTGTTIQVQKVGEQPNSFLVYAQRYDSTGRPVSIGNDTLRYVDQNGDHRINEKDLRVYHSPSPKVIVGLNIGMVYKRFSLSSTFRANFGAYVYNSIQVQNGSLGTFTAKANPTGFLSGGSSTYLDNHLQNPMYLSDYFVQKADFIRMDNINLSYSFGPISNGIGNLALNVNAQNLFVITPYKGLDPEIFSGIDGGFYPRPRVFTVGLTASLR